MRIRLECADGCAFDESFLKRGADVERIMAANDLDPSSFRITKERSSKYSSYQGMGRYFDYTVDTGEDSFTVTYADDDGFLEFFLHACASKDGS